MIDYHEHFMFSGRFVLVAVNSCLLSVAYSSGIQNNTIFNRPPDKSAHLNIIFLLSQSKHMLWVLKRTVSMRRFF